MDKLFQIEDYRRISYPNIKKNECPYFCVGYYIGKGWFQGNWKIFSEMWATQSNPDLERFIKTKESCGWIMFVCKLPELK